MDRRASPLPDPPQLYRHQGVSTGTEVSLYFRHPYNSTASPPSGPRPSFAANAPSNSNTNEDEAPYVSTGELHMAFVVSIRDYVEGLSGEEQLVDDLNLRQRADVALYTHISELTIGGACINPEGLELTMMEAVYDVTAELAAEGWDPEKYTHQVWEALGEALKGVMQRIRHGSMNVEEQLPPYIPTIKEDTFAAARIIETPLGEQRPPSYSVS